jgi:AAA domain
LDNDAVPNQKKLDEFALAIEKFYIEFNPFPTIEGTLIDLDSPLNELADLLKEKQIEIEFNREGELLLPQEGIELFDTQNKIRREKKIGAIYQVKIEHDKLIADAVKNLISELNIPKEHFNLVPYDYKIYSNQAIFTSKSFYDLNNMIGLVLQNCVVRFWINQDSFIGDWEKCHLKDDVITSENGKKYYEYYTLNNKPTTDNKLTFEGEKISANEYFMMAHHTINSYYRGDGIEKIEKRYVFEYDPDSPYFEKINHLELNDDAWSKIKERLNLDIFWCNTLKNTISFDFTNQHDFIDRVEQIKAIDWLDLTDYRESHKFKITPIMPKRFEEVKKELENKFKNKIRFKEDSSGQNLLLRYSYKLSEDEQDAKLKFLNTLNEYKKQGFDFKLDEQFKVKFILEVNEKLKEFEENVKFNKIRGAEIKVGDKIIGTLRKANFPVLELLINEDYRDVLNESLNENTASLDKIEPVLTGEVEKILRLKNTIEILQTNGGSLPNPNIVNFIFDSSKAKVNENITVFEETSEEWQDVKRTTLPSNKNINDSQLKAVLTTLYSEELAIIQGPPGTGKSTAISEIIWQHIRKNPKQKILLTSETHLAVDNAMDKLATPHNNLVKPIRFGKDDNLEEEGARFSLSRIQNWVEGNYPDPTVFDNGVSKWIKNISEKSSTYEKEDNIGAFITVWRELLNQPNSKIKTVFKNAYLDNVNVIGATCSSIAERTSEGKWATFLKNYTKVFNRKEYEDFQEGINSGNKGDRYWKANTIINESKVNFDVVIMDEASKATPPEFALPLLFGKKSIVVGDHRQLPPMLDENDFATTLEMIGERRLAQEFRQQDHNISHFEKLFLNPNISETLRASFDTQYRMHPQINEVIKQFYKDDNGLECGLDPQQVNDPNLNNPVSRYHGFNHEGFIEPQTHVIWVEVGTPEVLEGTSRVNFGEVEACRSVLQYLMNADGFDKFQEHWKNNPKAKPEETEIGLISFYGKQLHYLNELKQEFADKITIRSNTVDKFQGMERNIIIVSMVRSNKIAGSREQEPDTEIYGEQGYAKQDSLGFADVPNRLNVALSRAKRLLIIIGNSTHFSKEQVYKNVYDTIKNSPFDKIIDYKTLNKYNSKITK